MTCFDIAKLTIIRVLKSNSLNVLGNADPTLRGETEQSTSFVLSSYGHTQCQMIAEAYRRLGPINCQKQSVELQSSKVYN